MKRFDAFSSLSLVVVVSFVLLRIACGIKSSSMNKRIDRKRISLITFQCAKSKILTAEAHVDHAYVVTLCADDNATAPMEPSDNEL